MSVAATPSALANMGQVAVVILVPNCSISRFHPASYKGAICVFQVRFSVGLLFPFVVSLRSMVVCFSIMANHFTANVVGLSVGALSFCL